MSPSVCLKDGVRHYLLWSMISDVLTLLLTLSLFFILVNMFGCTSKKDISSIPPSRTGYDKKAEPHLQDFDQQGIASWYGPNFHGKKTANGEKYNMYSLTAAHRFLPFNSQVVVTNLYNQKKVIVRINDRGPFVDQRIIDLSYAAAQRLNMTKSGIAPVRIQTSIPLNFKNIYYIQVGSFLSRKKAQQIKQELEKSGYTGSRIQKFPLQNQIFWRVQAGVFHSYQTAKNHLSNLRKENPSSFIVESSTQP